MIIPMEGPARGTLSRKAPSRILMPASKRIAHDDGIFIGRPMRRTGLPVRAIAGAVLVVGLAGAALASLSRVEPVATVPARPQPQVDRLVPREPRIADLPMEFRAPAPPAAAPSAAAPVPVDAAAAAARDAEAARIAVANQAPPAPVPVPAPASPPVQRMSDAAVQSMMERVRVLLSTGDVASARRLAERVAATGEASAQFALAEMYDPAMLAQWKVRGVLADPAKARELYAQALQGGDLRAGDRIR